MSIQKKALVLWLLFSLLSHGTALAKIETWDVDDGSIRSGEPFIRNILLNEKVTRRYQE